VPDEADKPEDPVTGETKRDPFLRLLRVRLGTVMSYTAVRRGAPKDLADKVLASLSKQVERRGKLGNWKYQSYRLLVVLDRVEALRKTLASWIDPKKVEASWRIALAYVEAELGDLHKAAKLFEEVKRHDGLSADDCKRLADWYLVLENEEGRVGARAAYYRKQSEWRLSSRVSNEYYRLNRRARRSVCPVFFSKRRSMDSVSLSQVASSCTWARSPRRFRRKRYARPFVWPITP